MNIANLLQGMATLIWVVFFGVIAFMIFRSARNQPIKQSGSILIGLRCCSNRVNICECRVGIHPT